MKRWNILVKCLKQTTLKPLSRTRQGSKIDAIIPLTLQTKEIYLVLKEMPYDTTKDFTPTYQVQN